MSAKNSNKNPASNLQFEHIALGGTFDHFHKGHRQFLLRAFQISKRVTIGITSNKFANKIHKDSSTQSLKKRKKQLQNFLKKNLVLERSNIVKLNDVYGTTIMDRSVNALLVTGNTLKGAREINRRRKENDKTPLKVIIYPLVKTKDGKSISSHRIRNGEINKEGVIFYRELTEATPLNLPRKLRSTFREPFGFVIPAEAGSINKGMKKALNIIKSKRLEPAICVGDVVTSSILKLGQTPKLSIVDLKVMRKVRYKRVSEIGPITDLPRYKVTNPSGSITRKLTKSIHQALSKKIKSVIQVKGEEDLAVLPCVLLAPLNSAVIYGHFQHGVIVVEVSEEKKSEALKLLQQLKRFTSYDT
jgi:pantetheine-phosphate adenylyltransferase